ncbi:MAG: transposase [Treponema sp.]|jgi:putative transposase|nr:transposase [Treponema sp.]
MRPLRQFLDGAIYYVTSEINRNEMDLKPSRIKTMFLTFIKKAKQKYPFQLLNFCIMDNHINLLIKPERGQSLSKIMQWIKGNFAKYWNKIHNKQSGHLWGKRFFSKIINDARQFARVFDYIDKNPEQAGMVKQAEDWEFGGLYHHRQGRTDVVEIPRTAILELCFPGIGR